MTKIITINSLFFLLTIRLNAFLEGFYDIIPKRLISIFNEQELELLISGLPNVDIEDLKANTEYHKYQANSIQVSVITYPSHPSCAHTRKKREKCKLITSIKSIFRVLSLGKNDTNHFLICCLPRLDSMVLASVA